MYQITIEPAGKTITAFPGEDLMSVLRRGGFAPDAPCGGGGRCGKCRVMVDGKEVLACQTKVDGNMRLTLPGSGAQNILTHDTSLTQASANSRDGYCLAFDIGTTTVVGYLLCGSRELASASMGNPQASYGADVITRIRHALDGHMDALTESIRNCVQALTCTLCQRAHVDSTQITFVSLVGNPAMQQLFLGIRPDNLAQIPFAPVLTQAKTIPAKDILPLWENAELLIVPDIAGFIGADTVACILATGMDKAEEMTLLVDIGTNGEMVLGNRHRMVACSTAAGPALEGASIRCGMRAASGAIDYVWRDGKGFGYSVIGNQRAVGICGSGLVDAVAASLDAGLLNERGRLQTADKTIPLTDQVWLTQEDIRQVQLAKGAIAAGIELMAEHLGISLAQIDRVCLAGAFGSYLNPQSIFRIGLLPIALRGKLALYGNAAGSGAKLLQGAAALDQAQQIADTVEFLELASVPGFQRRFAQCMYFSSAETYWCQCAKSIGFTEAAALNVSALQPREDVRDMCAADKCGAYGKNWTCPPHCGTLEDCSAKLRSYRRGILLQTVGITEKAIDTKAFRRTEQTHLEQFHAFCRQIRSVYPDALCLGSGGCRICAQCAYPEACRFPEDACSSMEGYGLFVTQVCRDNGLAYHHGDRTITYTACVLF